MSAAKVDVLPMLDWYAAVLGKLGSARQSEEMREIRAAVAEQIEAHRSLLTGMGFNDISDADLLKNGRGTGQRVVRSRAALARIGGAA